jgi:hypothetical protein
VVVTTVGRIYLGRLVAYDPSHLLLEDASWLADMGRVHEALERGTFQEVEPYPDPMLVFRGVISDLTLWRHALPREAR